MSTCYNNRRPCGTGTYKPASFSEVDEATVDNLLNLNVKSVIYGIKYAMAAMQDGGTKGGAIVVNSSVMSHSPKSGIAGGGIYSASKSAADMLVQYAAAEGADSGALPHQWSTIPAGLFYLKWENRSRRIWNGSVCVPSCRRCLLWKS